MLTIINLVTPDVRLKANASAATRSASVRCGTGSFDLNPVTGVIIFIYALPT